MGNNIVLLNKHGLNEMSLYPMQACALAPDIVIIGIRTGHIASSRGNKYTASRPVRPANTISM